MNAFDATCFMAELADLQADLGSLSEPEMNLLWALRDFFSDLSSPELQTQDSALPRLKEFLK